MKLPKPLSDYVSAPHIASPTHNHPYPTKKKKKQKEKY